MHMGRRWLLFRHPSGTCFWIGEASTSAGHLLLVLMLVLEVERQRWFTFV